VTQSETITTDTTNVSKVDGVAGALLASSITYDTSQTGITTTDRQIRDAVARLACQLLYDIGRPYNDSLFS
jgi:hypothetical protein